MADQGTQAPRFEVRLTADTHWGWIRTRLSVERTLMSWVRTSVSLIGFGFTIVQFFEHLHAIAGVAPALRPEQFAESIPQAVHPNVAVTLARRAQRAFGATSVVLVRVTGVATSTRLTPGVHHGDNYSLLAGTPGTRRTGGRCEERVRTCGHPPRLLGQGLLRGESGT